MKKPTYLEIQLEKYKHDPVCVTQRAMLAFVRQIVYLMEEQGITRSQLAVKSGLQPAQITRILGGEHNLTVQTIGRVMAALGTNFQFTLQPFDAKPKQPAARKKKPAAPGARAPRAAR